MIASVNAETHITKTKPQAAHIFPLVSYVVFDCRVNGLQT